MSRTRKNAEERKKEIVAAAIRLAAEIGPDRVTTQRLADAVGLTQPAIFRHFPTKTEIWTAVGTTIVGSLDPAPAQEADGNSVDQLRALVTRQLEFIAQNPAVTAILFSRELHAENDRLRAHFENMIANRLRRYTSLVEVARRDGDLVFAPSPADAAALVLATIQGLAMRWSLQNRRFNLVVEGERLIFAMLATWNDPRGD